MDLYLEKYWVEKIVFERILFGLMLWFWEYYGECCYDFFSFEKDMVIIAIGFCVAMVLRNKKFDS